MSDTFNKAVKEAEKISTQDNAKYVLDNLYSKYEGLDTASQLALAVAPITGEAISAYETDMYADKTKEAFQEGDYVKAGGQGLLTGLSALGTIPLAGMAVRGGKAAVKAALKGADELDIVEKFGLADPKIMGKFEEGVKLKKDERIKELGYDPSVLPPEIQKKATEYSKIRPKTDDEALQAFEEWNSFINNSNNFNKVKPILKMPEGFTPSNETIARALSKDGKLNKPILNETKVKVFDKKGKSQLLDKIPEGHPIAARLDIPAYTNKDTWVVTLHDGFKKSGKVSGYSSTAKLSDVNFGTDSNVALKIARKAVTGADKKTGKPKFQQKATIARMNGKWKNHEVGDVQKQAKNILDNFDEKTGKFIVDGEEWVQVGMNPYRHSFFYDKVTMQPIKSADEVIQLGPLVLAKKVKYDDLLNYKTNEGLIFKQGGQISTGLEGIGENTIYRANGGGIDINYEGMEDIESETIESELPSLNPATEVRQLSKPTPVIIDDSENVGGETPEEREQREFSDRVATQNFAFRDNQQNIYNQFLNQYGGEKDPLDVFRSMSSTPIGRAAMAAGAGFGPNNQGAMGVVGNYIDQLSGIVGESALDNIDPLDLEDAELGGKTRGDILGDLVNQGKVGGLENFQSFEKLKNPYENVPMVYRAIAPGGIALTAGTAALNKLQDLSGLVGEAEMAGERVGIDRQGNIVPNIFRKEGGGLSSLQEMPMVYRQTNGQTSFDEETDWYDEVIDDSLLSGYQDDGGADILGGTTRLPDGTVATKRGGLDRPSDDEFTGTFVRDHRLAQDLKPLGSDLPWWQQLIVPGNIGSRIVTGLGNFIKDAAGIEYLADTLDGKSVAFTKDGDLMYLSPEDDPSYDTSLLEAEGDTSGLLAPKVKGVEKFKKELEEVEKRYSKKPTKRKNVFEIALLDQIYGPGVGKTMVG
jgi:hypothetical protein